MVGLVGVVGLVGLVLISARDDSSGDQAREPASDERSEATVSTTTTVEPLASSGDVTTTEPPIGEPETVYVNGAPGPVLEDGIDGTLVGARARTMDWIDLATGATRKSRTGPMDQARPTSPMSIS